MTTALEKHHTYLQKTIEMKFAIEGGYLVLAERLAKIRDEEMYLPEYENFVGFLDEMNISEATASKMINIYQRFVVEYEIPKDTIIAAGGWSTIAELLPHAKDKETALTLIDKVSGLMPGDKRRAMRELKTGIAMDTCKHIWDEIHLRQCKKCGERQKIYDN